MIIENAAPTFHALTGAQPVGQTQVATMADYAGTITTVKRQNDTYWTVATRTVVDAFRGPWNARGTACAIWMDHSTMEFVIDYREFVIDYWDRDVRVEVDRTRTLRAAIGVAATSTADRWARAQAA